jgi:hypothetical protein
MSKLTHVSKGLHYIIETGACVRLQVSRKSLRSRRFFYVILLIFINARVNNGITIKHTIRALYSDDIIIIWSGELNVCILLQAVRATR